MACVRQLWPGLWVSLVAQLDHSRTELWSEQACAVFQAGGLVQTQMSAPLLNRALLKGSWDSPRRLYSSPHWLSSEINKKVPELLRK